MMRRCCSPFVKETTLRNSVLNLLLAIGGGMALIQALSGCSATSTAAPPPPEYYIRTNLTSDQAGYVDSAGPVSQTDPRLKNPWGLTASPTGPSWLSANGTGAALIYNSAGAPISATAYTVPPPAGSTATATPTGIVYNGTSVFPVNANNSSASALYIVATQDGTISGWNATINNGQFAIVVDRSKSGASYTGLAIGAVNSVNYLFAANFEGGVIDIFDSNFNYVRSFTDPQAIAGYAPYNITNIQGYLVVAYAKQDSTKKLPVAGVGNGFIDKFNTAGSLQQRLITGGYLNAPWGMALAPSIWGKYSNRLLVANYGDGHINAYAFDSGSYQGTLLDGNSSNLVTIPGLRALTFGNGADAGSLVTLYLTADINNGQDGLYSAIQYTTLH